MKKVVIIYNTSHYIYAFKLNLIKELQKNGFKVIAIAPYDKYSDKFKELNVEYYELKMDNKGSNPIKDMSVIMQLFSIYKHLKPEAVLNFTIKPNIYSTIAASLLKIPTINNITGLGTVFINGGLSLRVVKMMYKFAFIFPKRVFFQNKDDMELFLSNNLVSKKKIALLPGSGVDLEKYKPMSKLQNHGKIIFLLIGRMIKDKGVGEFIEAAKILKDKFENIECHLLGPVGVVNLSAITIQELQMYENQGTIKYLGETNDIRPYIANSDVIVLPSYREGMPRTLLEASAMAKPIIGTNVPGCKDVVDDAENGFLCQVKNSIDLAEKMEKMLKLSSSEREAMGELGRQKIIKEFDEKIVLEAYSQELRSDAL